MGSLAGVCVCVCAGGGGGGSSLKMWKTECENGQIFFIRNALLAS